LPLAPRLRVVAGARRGDTGLEVGGRREQRHDESEGKQPAHAKVNSPA
jgi:hypothetical protein